MKYDYLDRCKAAKALCIILNRNGDNHIHRKVSHFLQKAQIDFNNVSYMLRNNKQLSIYMLDLLFHDKNKIIDEKTWSHEVKTYCKNIVSTFYKRELRNKKWDKCTAIQKLYQPESNVPRIKFEDHKENWLDEVLIKIKKIF